jgi:hypothetical protein
VQEVSTDSIPLLPSTAQITIHAQAAGKETTLGWIIEVATGGERFVRRAERVGVENGKHFAIDEETGIDGV